MSHRTPSPRKSVWKRLIITFVVLGLIFGGLFAAGSVLWGIYGDRISERLGLVETDYEGEGTGEVLITITAGEIGSDVAASLAQADVVMTYDAFYQLLLKQDPAVEFLPGTYRLKSQMSAEAALRALQDPENRMELTVTISEGLFYDEALALISGVVGIPMEDFETELENLEQFGIPAEAETIEGYLFPATYTFEPDTTAASAIQTLVSRMDEALAQHGVPEDREHEILTMASMIQREAGSNLDDFYRVSRVFWNRLDIGMKLESDATVTYGTRHTHTVWTTAEERADASNPWNTYANPGLPVGPIGLPGDAAIDAAMNPAAGDWLFFVSVNLETGETVFSNTLDEHEIAVQQLAEWCESTRARGEQYCD